MAFIAQWFDPPLPVERSLAEFNLFCPEHFSMLIYKIKGVDLLEDAVDDYTTLFWEHVEPTVKHIRTDLYLFSVNDISSEAYFIEYCGDCLSTNDKDSQIVNHKATCI